ncbi:MAG: hypothetical protein ACOX1P_16365 [Thermoguttaceae bacterium]|jgi:phosphatidylglycerophosphatase A
MLLRPRLAIMQGKRFRVRIMGQAIAGSWLLLAISGAGWASEVVTLANVADPGEITADEPIAAVFSAENAARYLDTASLYWQKSCTMFPGWPFSK